METGSGNRKAKQRSIQPVRWLAALLLYLLVSGATVELVHKHGNAVVDNAQAQGGCLSETGGATYQSLPLAAACSLCQFQRNLSGALLCAPHQALRGASSKAFLNHFAPAYRPFHPTYVGNFTRGRAPPRTILL